VRVSQLKEVFLYDNDIAAIPSFLSPVATGSREYTQAKEGEEEAKKRNKEERERRRRWEEEEEEEGRRVPSLFHLCCCMVVEHGLLPLPPHLPWENVPPPPPPEEEEVEEERREEEMGIPRDIVEVVSERRRRCDVCGKLFFEWREEGQQLRKFVVRPNRYGNLILASLEFVCCVSCLDVEEGEAKEK